jgi:hypothetical protein
MPYVTPAARREDNLRALALSRRQDGAHCHASPRYRRENAT